MTEDAASAVLGRSQIRRRLLALIALGPDNRLHLRELARRAGTTAGTAARELHRLEVAHFVERETEGRQVYYRIPRDSPVYRTIDEILRQTAGAAHALRQALAGLEGIESASIFGSYASGKATAGSDVDLLVVGTPDRDELTDRLEAVQHEIHRPVNEVVYPSDELTARRARGDQFVKSIDSGPTIAIVP